MDETGLSGGLPIDIIVYALIAGALVIVLRNVLGTKHGSERQRPNPFANQKTPVDGVDAPSARPDISPEGVDTDIDAGLVQIAIADRSFDSHQFIDNAKEAFALVVTAFGDGDRETLKDMLGPDVYKSFDGEITKREKAGHKALVEVHSVSRADIIEARLDRNKAFITMRFKASETYLLTDKDGKVVAGNADKVIDMTDVWVFSRSTKSRDPRWFVVETRDDVAEEDARPLPEAKDTSA